MKNSRGLNALLFFIALMWICFGLSYVIPINRFGIHPRSADGIIGIFASPFLHFSLSHIVANTSAIFVLGLLFVFSETSFVFLKLFLLTVLSGLGTWLLGGVNELHIGASGLIYGMLGFLLFRGFIKRDFRSLIVTGIVAMTYGAALWGILPVQQGVSWEAHLAGLASGIFVCALNRK